MFDESIINGEMFFPDTDDFASVRIKIRLPWYRSLPASCIEGIEVSIDGTAAGRDDLSLNLHGLHHKLDELAPLHEVLWYVLDTADLHVRTRQRLNPGVHEIKVAMRVRIPYSRDSYPQYAVCKKNLTLVGKDW